MKRLLSHKHPDFNFIFSSISVMTLSHKTVRIPLFFCTSVRSYKIDQFLFWHASINFSHIEEMGLYILTLCCMALEIKPLLQAWQGLVRAMFFIIIAPSQNTSLPPCSAPTVNQLSGPTVRPAYFHMTCPSVSAL